jgi:hypothetical protein
MKNRQVILHITDLHFGRESTADQDARLLALESLIRTITDLPLDWRPTIVCLTGDISCRGAESGYKLASLWLTDLLARLSIQKKGLFICAGNHDVDRSKAIRLSRPSMSTEGDKVLEFPPISEHYAAVFERYSHWARNFGIEPYKLGDTDNFLVGQRAHEEISFIALNTAWCCKDDEDKGRLWLGLPQIRHLEARGLFVHQAGRSGLPITVTLFHHPKEWLNVSEYTAYQPRPNTFDYMALRSDMVLTGHSHGEVRRADSIAETSLWFTGGATYAGKDYYNNFRLIQVEEDHLSYRTFEFDSRSAELRWGSGLSSTVSFPGRSVGCLKKNDGVTSLDEIKSLREKTEAHAKRLIDLKSRAIKPSGALPELTRLDVVAKVESETTDTPFLPWPKGEKTKTLLLSFFDALGKSRRTLLLGELGTGKSTLAAGAVAEVQRSSESAIAFLVPTKQLELPEKVTPGNLLDALSAYFCQAVAPGLFATQIQTLLEARTEMTIFLDGLDEIDSTRIGPLLQEFAALPEHWPTIRVVATGRPIELSGLNYTEWQIIRPISLTDENRQRLFENEALAEGKSPAESRQHAAELEGRLEEMPGIARMVSSPFAARLLYTRMSKGFLDGATTLGDLVFDSIEDRLAGWSRRDAKQKVTEYFEKYFPDARSRSTLLGTLALRFASQTTLPVADVRQALLPTLSHLGALAEPCATEALEFFGKTGLVVINEHVQFPIQVFLQALQGLGLLSQWKQSGSLGDVSVDRWREVGFAATAARRNSTLPDHLHQFRQYITAFAPERHFVPVIAQVVNESKSEELGRHFVSEAQTRQNTRIMFLDNEWDESARNIAQAIKIAGPSGFSWFYYKCLNPQFPLTEYGSRLVGMVFSEWVRLSMESANADEKKKIGQIASLHVQAETIYAYEISGSAVFLVPEAFDDKTRLILLTQGLMKPQFSELAEEHLRLEMSSGNRSMCESVVLGISPPPSTRAALIWLDYNQLSPPSSVIQSAIRSAINADDSYSRRLVEVCESRLGTDKWKALLRYYLSASDNQLSAGAALLLYDLGERNTTLLRAPLLRALHDGAYVPRAEQVLSILLETSGPDDVLWLAKSINQHSRRSFGGHSGEFRLLLRHIHKIENAPLWFAFAIDGLGEFVLPRYPEVRQQLRDLLSGTQGEAYRAALRSKLNTPSLSERRAAAAVLVTCFPHEEALALQTVVRSIAGGYITRWHEWEAYLLSINFGRGPLIALKSALPDLSEASASFGYRLLLNNKIELNDAEHDQALRSILGYGPQIREMEVTWLRSPRVRLALLAIVLSPKANDDRVAAARLLLDFHKSYLNSNDFVLCRSLAISGALDSEVFVSEIEKLRADNDYATAVEELERKHQAENSPRPLLSMLRASIYDVSVWDDIVWRLICEERSPFSLSGAGLGLLEIGRVFSDLRSPIGNAAAKHLTNIQRRAQTGGLQQWADDVYQWLVLIADEFVGIPKEQIEAILISKRAIHREVTVALLYRLGTTPAGLLTHGTFNVSASTEVSAFSATELFEAARPTELFPSDLCNRLEATIAHRVVTSNEIDNIRVQGTNGALIASVLSFVQGDFPDVNYVLPILPLISRMRRTDRQGCINRLITIAITGHYDCSKTASADKARLIGLIENAYSKGVSLLEGARLLLDIRGFLTGEQAHVFLQELIAQPYLSDSDMRVATVRWLVQARENDSTELQVLVRSIQLALVGLAEMDWDEYPVAYDRAIIGMMLALASWILSGEQNRVAADVFVKGLKTVFKQGSSHALNPLIEAFEILEPMLSVVNPELLHLAISSAKLDPDPLVRALVIVLNAFGGTWS